MLSLKNVMMAVVETLLNKFEEDQAKNREMQQKALNEQPRSRCTDNCSDIDSFNQVCVHEFNGNHHRSLNFGQQVHLMLVFPISAKRFIGLLRIATILILCFSN